MPDQAEFLDEAKAKEVLKPVAEAILAAPDHSVLIAGTTATDGDQASSVVLSEKRAEAVKELLTDTYNVPESQLETIGLGYELDPFERGKDIDGTETLWNQKPRRTDGLSFWISMIRSHRNCSRTINKLTVRYTPFKNICIF